MNNKECGKPMPRAKAKCLLDTGHSGHCRYKSVWHCDTCNRSCRGTPAARDPDQGIYQCFMCMLPALKYHGMIGRHKLPVPPKPTPK